MKKKYLAFLAFMAMVGITIGCSSAKYVDAGGTQLFTRIIEADGISSDDLYDICEKWCMKNFRAANGSVIDFKDKEAHSILGTYIADENYAWPDWVTIVSASRYNVTLNTKQGKVKITMQLQQVRFGTVTVYSNNSVSWIDAGPINEKKAGSEERFNKLVASLEEAIKNKGDDSNW